MIRAVSVAVANELSRLVWRPNRSDCASRLSFKQIFCYRSAMRWLIHDSRQEIQAIRVSGCPHRREITRLTRDLS